MRLSADVDHAGAKHLSGEINADSGHIRSGMPSSLAFATVSGSGSGPPAGTDGASFSCLSCLYFTPNGISLWPE
jgi:hypothetical protein